MSLGGLALAIAACTANQNTTFDEVLRLEHALGDVNARGLSLRDFNNQCRNQLNRALAEAGIGLSLETAPCTPARYANASAVAHYENDPLDDYMITLDVDDDQASKGIYVWIDQAAYLFL